MRESRRRWLIQIGEAVGLLVFSRLAAAQNMPTARPLPSPNAPDPHAPAGLEQPPMAGPGSNSIDPQLQRQIRSDVEQLFQLALQLKQQIESTDLNSVLSLGIVKKAQQIEKLAKHIREHAKG